MARVHLLDDELINKIAAGEVVERPASVVKELVENAIDAGAQSVKVSLKDGGRALIEVSDDGHGMSADDAALALRRHTTSKLRSADDLFDVGTMGFRGEALASISSVSRFTLQTMSRDEHEGVRIHHENGETTKALWNGAFGTSVAVKDLFFNVPARKTFMKSAAAEFAVCHEYIQALALALPERGFRLLHNDREMFSVSPLPIAEGWARGEKALRLRAKAILGEEITAKLIYVQKAERHARVEGLISPPGLDKASAKHMFTFVNRRWVKDKLLRNGILRGYHSHILRGKFPVAIMYLDVDSSLVDVNVHPAKTELRLQYGSEVQGALAMAVREGLRQGAWGQSAPNPSTAASASYVPKKSDAVPLDFDLLLDRREPEVSFAARAAKADALLEDKFKASKEAQSSVSDVKPLLNYAAKEKIAEKTTQPNTPLVKRTTYSFDKEPYEPIAPPRSSGPSPLAAHSSAPSPSRSLPFPTKTGDEATKAIYERPKIPAFASQRPPDAPAPVQDKIPWDELNYMGAFQKCFLFFEHKDHMLVLDQHAFHERILYERLLQNPELLKRSQPLLMPEVIDLSPTECEDLASKRGEFINLGFDFDKVTPTEIEVKAVPSLLVNKDIQGVLSSLAKGARDHQEILHDVLASVACHAAVRAGEDLPERELKQLLGEAKSVDFYLNCPHGRRVLRWFKQSQVAAWFDRLG